MADTKKTDHLKGFKGAINLRVCEKLFGKDKAVLALQAIAEAGGYGTFTAIEARSMTLAAPKTAEVKDKINCALDALK